MFEYIYCIIIYCFENNISEAVVVVMNADTFKYHYDTTRVFFEWQVQGGEPDKLELWCKYIIILILHSCGSEVAVESEPQLSIRKLYLHAVVIMGHVVLDCTNKTLSYCDS